MGNQSNRILPHKDPAVTTTTQKQQTSRRVRQRQNSLRRSWNPQEQPRRRVQSRSSVTKYNLEDSMAKVQQEEEQQTVISTTAAAAEQNPTSTCHSMLLPDHKYKLKIKKRKIRLLPFTFSGSGRPCNKSKNSILQQIAMFAQDSTFWSTLPLCRYQHDSKYYSKEQWFLLSPP